MTLRQDAKGQIQRNFKRKSHVLKLPYREQMTCDQPIFTLDHFLCYTSVVQLGHRTVPTLRGRMVGHVQRVWVERASWR